MKIIENFNTILYNQNMSDQNTSPPLHSIENEDDLRRNFGSEAQCQRFLFQQRWPNGFDCPTCHSSRANYFRSRRLWYCTHCGKQVSVLAGTLLANTKKPLPLWFKALWLFLHADVPMTASSLKRLLGLGGYQTAWTWLQKLRLLAEELHLESDLPEPIIKHLESFTNQRKTRGHRGWSFSGHNRGVFREVVRGFTHAKVHIKSDKHTLECFQARLLTMLTRLEGVQISRKHASKWLGELLLRVHPKKKSNRVACIASLFSVRAVSYWRLILRPRADSILCFS